MKRRRLLLLGLLWLGGTTVAAAMPGCYGRNCEGDVQDWGVNPGEGRMVDENTWESSPQDGKWLSFPRQRFWRFDIRALGGRTPEIVIPYVSANEDPNNTNFSSTIGGGNLAEIYDVHENRLVIKNGTCSDYYLRLVVVAADKPPPSNDDAGNAGDASSDASDASTDADAGIRDGATDAEAGP